MVAMMVGWVRVNEVSDGSLGNRFAVYCAAGIRQCAAESHQNTKIVCFFEREDGFWRKTGSPRPPRMVFR